MSSHDQALVLYCKKEFKVKTNSKLESTRFIKANVHSQEESAGKLKERVMLRMSGLLTFVFGSRAQKGGIDLASLSPPSRQEAPFPSLSSLCFWCFAFKCIYKGERAMGKTQLCLGPPIVEESGLLPPCSCYS